MHTRHYKNISNLHMRAGAINNFQTTVIMGIKTFFNTGFNDSDCVYPITLVFVLYAS